LRSTINLFTEVNQRGQYKFIIGGGCITQDWANEIGADGYAPDAASAIGVQIYDGGNLIFLRNF
jgi:5-methyltetrahydrofolate--homocysteine methyltransferase